LGSEKKQAITPAAPPSMNLGRQIIPHETSGPARNAIGASPSHALPTHGASGTDGVAKNDIGARGGSNGRTGGPGIMRPSAVPSIASSAPHNNAVISGTGMRRPGSGPATLGGVAKNVSAVNGTNIRPKQ
jgi:hypothetical protein